jgi:20S proteasome subunit alpha 7
MSWISSLDGPTKGKHEEVPTELLEEAEKAAKQSLESDDEDETSPREGEGEKMEE